MTKNVNPKSSRARVWATAFVTLATLALAAILMAIVWWRYTIFRNDVDLGIFTQVIASAAHGFSSTAEGGVNHLLVHWSPIIVTMWPLLRAFGPIGLEYGQALMVAATLVPVWALARARVGDRLAILLTAVAAIYPMLWGNGVGDFHEMAFVPLLCATFVYALDRRKWALGVAAVVLLACTKEDQFPILACNGFIVFVTSLSDRARRRFGLVTVGVGAIGALVYFGVVRPHLNADVPYLSFRFFDWSAQPGAPGANFGTLLTPRIEYVLIVLAPLLFLPCISRYGLFLLPGLIEITASHRAVTLMPGAHYSALLTGYALAAFVDGFARLRSWNRPASSVAIAVAAAISISIQLFASPMEYWYYLYRRPNAHDVLLDRTLQGLPRDAAVGAEGEIFAHLGLDPNASPVFNQQPWFVYDETHFSTQWRYVDEPLVRRLVAAGDYAVLQHADGIVVLRKRRLH